MLIDLIRQYQETMLKSASGKAISATYNQNNYFIIIHPDTNIIVPASLGAIPIRSKQVVNATNFIMETDVSFSGDFRDYMETTATDGFLLNPQNYDLNINGMIEPPALDQKVAFTTNLRTDLGTTLKSSKYQDFSDVFKLSLPTNGVGIGKTMVFSVDYMLITANFDSVVDISYNVRGNILYTEQYTDGTFNTKTIPIADVFRAASQSQQDRLKVVYLFDGSVNYTGTVRIKGSIGLKTYIDVVSRNGPSYTNKLFGASLPVTILFA